MKYYASIAAGVCTIWLGFEPDPDHSSDPGTGCIPDFLISAGYLKKLKRLVEEPGNYRVTFMSEVKSEYLNL